MANHYGALPIVSKGLVFCVDAKDKDSYPGSGTTWTDVVNSRPGTITNSPTFNSSGYFDFDGSNDYVDFADHSTFEITAVTLSVWIYYDSSGTYGTHATIFGRQGGGSSPYKLRIYNSGATAQIGLQIYDTTYRQGPKITPNTTFDHDKWVYISCTYEYDSSASQKIYVNDSLADSNTTGGGNIDTSSSYGFEIGRSNTNLYWGGNFAIGHIYNRALSLSEISQNFNAKRGRFGV